MGRGEKIQLTDRPIDIITKMCEGNPGALTVLIKLTEADPMMGIIKILSLDDMNIRGSSIWVAFKDHCHSDMAAFEKAIMDRDPEMIKTINKSSPERIAVTGGASFA